MGYTQVHSALNSLKSTIHRDGHELLWNVINYVTNYMLKIVYLITNYSEKMSINITITNYNF